MAIGTRFRLRIVYLLEQGKAAGLRFCLTCSGPLFMRFKVNKK